MAVLERRAQILFEATQYAALEAEAATLRMSVGALVRDAVAERLRARNADRSEALKRVFARADENPGSGTIDWEAEKDALEQRDSLRDLP